MNRLIALMFAIWSVAAFATDRQIINPDSGGNLNFWTNIGGTETKNVVISGTTGTLDAIAGFASDTAMYATASVPGIVSTTTQTFAGNKTFQATTLTLTSQGGANIFVTGHGGSDSAYIEFDRGVTQEWAVGLNDFGPGGVAGYAWTNFPSAKFFGGINPTGGWYFGPAVTGNFTGQVHTINGSLFSGNVTSSDASGEFIAGVNAHIQSSNAQANRTDTTTGGMAILMDNRTAANTQAIGFYANQPGDSTTTNAIIIASATHQGLWKLGVPGGSGSPPYYQQFALAQTVSNGSGPFTIVSGNALGTWNISIAAEDTGGIQHFCSFGVFAGIENGVQARYAMFNGSTTSMTSGNCSIAQSNGTFTVTITGLNSNPVIVLTFNGSATTVTASVTSGVAAGSPLQIRLHQFF